MRKKPGDNLLKQIHEYANEIGLSTSVLSHCCFVTDDASNLILALSAYHRITCACHMLSTVLRHVLQPSTSAHSDCPLDVGDLPLVEVISKTISQCKSVTAYFKRTGLNNKLTNTLKQTCDTQWNSVLYMLKSVHESNAEVELVLKDKNKEERLEGINWILVDTLINYLAPFEKASKLLEGTSYRHFTKFTNAFA